MIGRGDTHWLTLTETAVLLDKDFRDLRDTKKARRVKKQLRLRKLEREAAKLRRELERESA